MEVLPNDTKNKLPTPALICAAFKKSHLFLIYVFAVTLSGHSGWDPSRHYVRGRVPVQLSSLFFRGNTWTDDYTHIQTSVSSSPDWHVLGQDSANH